MDATPNSLDDLRRQIDEVDAGIHDLLMRRAAIVADVAAHKKATDAGLSYQPAREAFILRRLLARHDCGLSQRFVVRLWREILGATTRLQGDFRVAAPRIESDPEIWTLAREHFGSEVDFIIQGSVPQIINAVREGEAQVGIVPLPVFDEPQPWWARLLQGDQRSPRIVGRLPFLERQPDTGHDRVDAFVIGAFDRGKTAADRSVVALECEAATSRSAVYEAASSAGLQPGVHAIWETRAAGAEVRWHLIDIQGYVDDPQEQLGEIGLALGAGLRGLRALGGYATPVRAAAG